MTGTIRVGIGGWTFEPWRKTFYPKGLPQKRELEYASWQLTSIEINGTYYRTQKAESFAQWHEETPDSFVFALKGPRFTTNRGILAEAGSSVERFFASGVMNLKEKLGPINWQFAPTKRYDPHDFEAFLKLLPKSIEGRPLRHAVEVRHESFRTAEFVDLLRAHKTGVVLTDKDAFPQIPDVTSSFIYVRLQRSWRTRRAAIRHKRSTFGRSGRSPGLRVERRITSSRSLVPRQGRQRRETFSFTSSMALSRERRPRPWL